MCASPGLTAHRVRAVTPVRPSGSLVEKAIVFPKNPQGKDGRFNRNIAEAGRAALLSFLQ
jgi:hypothetical protein